MSMVNRDEDGLVICPNCKRHYTPLIESEAWRRAGNPERNPDIPIQVQFPNMAPFHREQAITGICSDKCWDEYLGVVKRRPSAEQAKKEAERKAAVQKSWTAEGENRYFAEASQLDGLEKIYDRDTARMCPACFCGEHTAKEGYNNGREIDDGELIAVHLICTNCKADLTIGND